MGKLLIDVLYVLACTFLDELEKDKIKVKEKPKQKKSGKPDLKVVK